MKFAIEAILLVIILFCSWTGYKKGLVMCIGSILAIIISLYVGDLLADTFSPEVQPVLRPFLSGYMDGTEGIITENMNELLGSSSIQLSVDDALEQNPNLKHSLCVNSYKDVGVYTSTAEKMADEAVALSEETDSSLSVAIVDVLCGNFTYCLVFSLFFILSLIIITVIGNIFNLSFRIPEMDRLNNVGGAIAGAITGIMFCMIITWVLKFSGVLFPEEEMSHTLLTALFIKIDFMSLFLTI